MGGMGSGSYYRWASKTPTGGLKRLDVRELHRGGQLIRGNFITSRWSRNGKPFGSIGIRFMNENLIRLEYTLTDENEKTWSVETPVDLEYTDCNYGGRRVWMRCPGCSRRAAIIYSNDGYFKCRHCHGLTYASSQESGNWNNEAIRRLREIQEKLKCEEWAPIDCLYRTPDRPKHMQRRTYDRLLRTYQQRVISYSGSWVAANEKYSRQI